MAHMSSRRTFVKQASLLVAGAYLTPWSKLIVGAEDAIADTSSGQSSRRRERDRQDIQRHSVRRANEREKPLHAARQAHPLDRDARRARVRANRAARWRQLGNDGRRLAGAEKRRLSRPECVHARLEGRTQASGDGLAARRWILERLRLRTHSRRDQPRPDARRRRRDAESSAERVRVHVSRRCDGLRLRALEQRRACSTSWPRSSGSATTSRSSAAIRISSRSSVSLAAVERSPP